MDVQTSLIIGTAVTGLAQVAKFEGVPDKRGPILVMVIALLCVSLWGFSNNDLHRATLWAYFEGWISISLTAAGVFGFTRSGPESVTSTKRPPEGAGANPTEKS